MRRLTAGLALALAAAAVVLVTTSGASAAKATAPYPAAGLQCQEPGLSYLCADVGLSTTNYENEYVGHDEPSLLFYSNTRGAGNDNTYQMTLPTDPTAMPSQDGTGTSWNFQLHPAFWFGMALCDNQSFPQYDTTTCNPDTDANIYDSANPSDPHFIGHHPGTAFMEMQFYPPGWVTWPAGNSCDARYWCAALNIDSYLLNGATGAVGSCAATTGLEYVNFAFITRDGVPTGPPQPGDATNATYTPNSDTLFMRSGDRLAVRLHDTSAGFRVDISDLNTGQTGYMVASAANDFGHPLANGSDCAVPYTFHPMYSTSTVHTRVPWAAHSYNVAYSDEIGHFDYCTGAPDPGIFGSQCPAGYLEGGTDEAQEPTDGDDSYCFDGFWSSLVPVTGCLGTNVGFDGTSYAASAWPGNGNDANTPTPVKFLSPYINGNKYLKFSQVGFEADLPRIEVPDPNNPNLACDRTTGAGCVNPPPSDDPGGNPVAFYPIFTTGQVTGWVGQCGWREGGPSYGVTLNNFGGNSTAEYGPLEQSVYQASANTVSYRYNNFRSIRSNPCP